MEMIIVFLTCADIKQAEKISDILLTKKLVACAKTFQVNSKFWWEGKKDNADEILVTFETVRDNFEGIEEEVLKNHSYQTPMLFAIPVLKTTKKVEKWLKEELNG